MVGWHLLALLGIEIAVDGAIGLHAHVAHGWTAPAAIGLAFAIYAGVRVVLVAAEFILCRWRGDPIPRAMLVSPLRALAMYLVELAGWIVMFSVVMPFVAKRDSVIDRPPGPNDGAASPAPGGLPILLVHGLACNRGNWFLFRRRLERAGHRAFALDYTPWFATIDAYVPQLAAAIDEVLRATGSPRVIVIAHSMGGLVTRAYLQRFGSDRVAQVVTLGTPHHGTWMTRFGFTPNVRNMAENSAWLAALRAGEAARSADPYAHFTCVFTYHDNLVAPQHNATLPGAQNVPLSGIGHVSLVLSRPVFERVLATLPPAG